jgi:hypothetical protein
VMCRKSLISGETILTWTPAGMMGVWVAANRLHTYEWSNPTNCNGFADQARGG